MPDAIAGKRTKLREARLYDGRQLREDCMHIWLRRCAFPPFLERFSDLIFENFDLGRRLRTCALVVSISLGGVLSSGAARRAHNLLEYSVCSAECDELY